MTNQNNNQGDQSTGLGKLIEQAEKELHRRVKIDSNELSLFPYGGDSYDFSEENALRLIKELIDSSYKAGALAAIEATKLTPSIIRADFGGDDFLFSSWDDAVRDQRTLSDAFLNSLTNKDV